MELNVTIHDSKTWTQLNAPKTIELLEELCLKGCKPEIGERIFFNVSDYDLLQKQNYGVLTDVGFGVIKVISFLLQSEPIEIYFEIEIEETIVIKND